MLTHLGLRAVGARRERKAVQILRSRHLHLLRETKFQGKLAIAETTLQHRVVGAQGITLATLFVRIAIL